MTTGPDTLCLFQLSYIHWTATLLAESRGDGMAVGIVGDYRGYQKTRDIGNDCAGGGWA